METATGLAFLYRSLTLSPIPVAYYTTPSHLCQGFSRKCVKYVTNRNSDNPSS